MAGRPTKLDEETQNKITQAVRAGNYMETAAAYAGISKDTLYAWLRRGAREIQRLANDDTAKPDKKEAPYVVFSDAINKAQAESEVDDIILIGKHAEFSWQAAAWRQERKNPEKWGRRTLAVEHSGTINLPVHFEGEDDITD